MIKELWYKFMYRWKQRKVLAVTQARAKLRAKQAKYTADAESYKAKYVEATKL